MMPKHATIAAPAAASATGIVSNTAVVNGSLTIAAQPGVARPLAIVIAPGSPGITAGSLALDYVANDGTDTVETFSLIGAANSTPTTSKGVMHVNSAVISGAVGGTTPTIQIGTNANLSVPMPENCVATTILKEGLDGADVAVGSKGTLTTKGVYHPNTAPNGTHNYDVDYTVLAPG